jgi:hypothetical protein
MKLVATTWPVIIRYCTVVVTRFLLRHTSPENIEGWD